LPGARPPGPSAIYSRISEARIAEPERSAAIAELSFSLAGAGCTLRTNSPALAQILERSTIAWQGSTACTLNVEATLDDFSPLGPPHFRGMHHVVVASFGAANVFVFDLRRRVVTAKVSQTLANDAEFWPRVLLPIAAGVFASTIGLLPLHSACLSRDGDAMLIAGESGTGKSTLAVALAQRGFDYISDDWTYLTSSNNILTANGTAARIKLLPDAHHHFPSLTTHATHISMNGELAYEVHADETFGARLQQQSHPRMLIFFRRTAELASRCSPLESSAARLYMERSVERLPPQLAEAAALRSTLMEQVAALPCWSFECGGPPAFIAQQLEAFFEDRRKEWTV
jgi:hypothetical protein